jgi:hypothetical protein
VEAGCPSAWVGCEGLAVACMAQLEGIWQRLPTASLAGRRVSDVCPFSCGMCEAHCELLSREILTAPEHDVLEVQRLRFALPVAASELPGPSAQVKVRAPDALGQKMRVRACEFFGSRTRQYPYSNKCAARSAPLLIPANHSNSPPRRRLHPAQRGPAIIQPHGEDLPRRPAAHAWDERISRLGERGIVRGDSAGACCTLVGLASLTGQTSRAHRVWRGDRRGARAAATAPRRACSRGAAGVRIAQPSFCLVPRTLAAASRSLSAPLRSASLPVASWQLPLSR